MQCNYIAERAIKLSDMLNSLRNKNKRGFSQWKKEKIKEERNRAKKSHANSKQQYILNNSICPQK